MLATAHTKWNPTTHTETGPNNGGGPPAQGRGQVSLDGDGDFWRHYLTDDGDEYELREDEDGKLFYLYVP